MGLAFDTSVGSPVGLKVISWDFLNAASSFLKCEILKTCFTVCLLHAYLNINGDT